MPFVYLYWIIPYSLPQKNQELNLRSLLKLVVQVTESQSSVRRKVLNRVCFFRLIIQVGIYHRLLHNSCLFVCLFSWCYNPFGCIFHTPIMGFSLLIWGFLITHNDTPQSVGLLWTCDQSVAQTSTWQHTTITADKLPCPRWDSNPQFQRASSCRPTP